MRTLVAVLLVCGAASAAAPPLLNVQGTLRNAAGPVDGTYTITVLLYTQESGGTPIYSEGHPSVVATDGVFALSLGAIDALPLDAIDTAAALWVAVKVEGEPELPRSRLASVAYALSSRHAVTADALSGPAADLACTGCVGATELAPGLLAKVAFTGSYDDLSGAPALALVATSGKYSDLDGAPGLAPVATSGKYSDLSGGPDLSGYAALALPNTFSVAQTFAAGAVVGPASGCDPSKAGRIRFDSAQGRMWLCDGVTDRRFKMCDDACPSVALVACGQPAKTDCGDPCPGVGTLCASGLACTGGACRSTLGAANNPASSCASILAEDSLAASGTYWLKPAGTAYQAYCEMSKAAGGWTRVRENHGVSGLSFNDQTVINPEGVGYSQILFVYKSGSAIGGAAYPTSLPGSNPVGFKLLGKNWGGPTGWSGSTCGLAVDTYSVTYTGNDFAVSVGASTTASFQVAILEGMAGCTTNDNSGPATLDLYVR